MRSPSGYNNHNFMHSNPTVWENYIMPSVSAATDGTIGGAATPAANVTAGADRARAAVGNQLRKHLH